jgi:hypothetical protein
MGIGQAGEPKAVAFWRADAVAVSFWFAVVQVGCSNAGSLTKSVVWLRAMAVSGTHSDYDASAQQWARARDVLSGEDAVKAAGEKLRLRQIGALSDQGTTVEGAPQPGAIRECTVSDVRHTRFTEAQIAGSCAKSLWGAPATKGTARALWLLCAAPTTAGEARRVN